MTLMPQGGVQALPKSTLDNLGMKSMKKRMMNGIESLCGQEEVEMNDTDQGSKVKDPLALPVGPITRARVIRIHYCPPPMKLKGTRTTTMAIH
ncbi:hypothetical protein JCGZ_06354 [Jatropha curcas]|uniref:Uncharacterized protein n=1 Tax=Jatropha curcas TaxID=180498 RepID=A0A067JCF3_JATCU|nr:hypothetical protein JCGZ_06354 [Jatropha curcas]